jgi:hypothetical protein
MKCFLIVFPCPQVSLQINPNMQVTHGQENSHCICFAFLRLFSWMISDFPLTFADMSSPIGYSETYCSNFVMKSNLMHYLLLIYFVKQPLHISGVFIAHHQEIFTVYIKQLVRVIRLVDCQLSVNYNV